MKISILRPDELGPAELGAWRAFQERDLLLQNPFLSAEFARAVHDYRGNVHVAVLRSGPRVVGLFPFQRHPLGVGRPVGAGFTDAQGMLCEPGLKPDAHELLRACGLAVWEFDHLLGGQFEDFHTVRRPSLIMDLTPGYAAYLEQIRSRSTKTYKSVAYRGRRLGRDVGELRHVFDSRDPHDLRTLLGWKSAQYRETGRPDLFADRRFTRLIERLHREDGGPVRGVLSMLYAGDRPIAGHFGLLMGAVFAGWFPAYDREFAWYSPGLVQHLRMAEDAAERGVRHIHLGKSPAPYKDFLSTAEMTVAEGRIARPGVPAVLHWSRTVPASRVRSALRRSEALRAAVRRARTFRNRISRRSA